MRKYGMWYEKTIEDENCKTKIKLYKYPELGLTLKVTEKIYSKGFEAKMLEAIKERRL